MLGLIAQYAPSLIRTEIIKWSTSLSWIWNCIRRHYNFQQSHYFGLFVQVAMFLVVHTIFTKYISLF